MDLTFSCPACGHSNRAALDGRTDELECAACESRLRLPAGAVDGDRLNRCLVCPSHELFVRKDFPQRLGVGIVVFGFAASCIAWANYQLYLTFAILFATALVDVVLYCLVGESLTCYRCGAQYRGVASPENHGAFELATHERYRQQAARLAEHSQALDRAASRP